LKSIIIKLYFNLSIGEGIHFDGGNSYGAGIYPTQSGEKLIR